MKKSLIVLILLFAIVFKGNAQNEVLTNKTIINLSKKKLQESIIISKINSSNCQFDVSTDALIDLKDNAVSDKVVEAMIAKSKLNGKKSGKKEIDNILSNFEESGIYFRDSASNEYVKLDATSTTGEKTGGFGQALAASYTGGISSMKRKLQIGGARANYKLTKSVKFYLFFESTETSLNKSRANKESDDNNGNIFAYMMTQNHSEAASPNDFKVLKCSVRGKNREFTAGSASSYASKGGLSGKEIVSFQYKKIGKNLFELTFPDGIKAGQYIFYYAGNTTANNPYMLNGNNDIKVYDFEILEQ